MSEWIKFPDQKPEEYNLVDLEVTTSDGLRRVGFYSTNEGTWWQPTTLERLEVIAWKKPSEPYMDKPKEVKPVEAKVWNKRVGQEG